MSAGSERFTKLTHGLNHLLLLVGAEVCQVMSRRLELLNSEREELCRQLATRRYRVEERLKRWADFERDYQQLINKFNRLDTKTFETEKSNIEDVIFNLKNVSYLHHHHHRF